MCVEDIIIIFVAKENFQSFLEMTIQDIKIQIVSQNLAQMSTNLNIVYFMLLLIEEACN